MGSTVGSPVMVTQVTELQSTVERLDQQAVDPFVPSAVYFLNKLLTVFSSFFKYEWPFSMFFFF